MRVAGIVLLCVFLLYPLNTQAEKARVIVVSGIELPLPEGATLLAGESRYPADPSIATYAVPGSLEETIVFYESFLKGNRFLVLGGRNGENFNASVKKGQVMCTLRIFRARNNRTIVQCIW